MATIRTSLSLYDGMTGPLQNIHKALGMVLDRFEAVRDAADAWGGAAVRLDSLDGRTVNNTLTVQAADALDGLEQFAGRAGRLDGSAIRAALLLDAEDPVFDREISAALSLGTVEAAGMYETFAGAVRDGSLGNTLLLNTAGAAEKYKAFTEPVQGGVLGNALLLDTAGAVDKYETFTDSVQYGVLGNALLLDTVGAAEKYKTFTEAVRDGVLGNALLLDTVGAAGKYEAFAEALRDGVWGSVLLLDTVGAVGKYRAFTEAVRDSALENALTLNMAGAAEKYETFAEAARGGFLENFLLLDTVGAVGKYEAFTGAARDGVLENALTLNTGDGMDAFSRFLWETDGNSVAIRMDVDAPQPPAAFDAAAGFVEAWSGLEPVLLGAAGALDMYSGAQMTANAAGLISQGVLLGAAAAFADSTAAQYGLNDAIAACPASRLAAGVNTLMTVFYAAGGAADSFAGESLSAAGVVGGTFSLLGDYVTGSFVVPFWNALASAANFVGNVFTGPAAAVKVLFYDMALTVVGHIRNMAGAIENVINKIPGVSVNITSGLDGFTSGLEQARRQARENSGWVEYAQKIDRAGYSVEMDNSVFSLPQMPALAEDWGIAPMVSFDFGNAPDSVYVAARTANADTLDYMEEDLAWMRDLAEREAVNQFTTAEITVEQHNENYISKDTDLDGIMDAWAYDFARRLDASGEGVHD